MIINHNIAALNTYRQLSANNASAGKSLEKLSSGLRINKAGDDAAGLAISEKMRGQIRGLDQADRNAQDGISLIQTAEGALSETHSILQRMRELSVQGANDTLTSDDRTKINQELTQLSAEVDRIGNNTEFNTKKLLNNDLGKATASVGTILSNAGKLAAGAGFTTTLTGLTDAGANALGIAVGDVITVTGTKGGTQFTQTHTVVTGDTMSTINDMFVAATAGSFSATAGTITVSANAAGTASMLGAVTVTAKDSTGVDRTAFNNAINNFTETQTASDVHADSSAYMQIGANANQNLQVDIKDMRANALGINGVTVTTRSSASISITSVDAAIKLVSTERSKLGSFQNRLEHTITNLKASSENLTASESRIRDVDMAKEMMEFTKTNILSQAAQAMLAQANQAPQGVLQLLR